MAEPGGNLNLDDDLPVKQTPWGLILSVTAIVALILLAFWLTRTKKNEEARTAVLNVLDKELDQQQADIKVQREKVMELTRQVESLRGMIQAGQTPNSKAAIKEFNQLATQQRAERDKFAQMAEAYNKKVAQYRELKE